jgi:hypothetical protein
LDECIRGHDLTDPANVAVNAKGHRRCRACDPLRQRDSVRAVLSGSSPRRRRERRPDRRRRDRSALLRHAAGPREGDARHDDRRADSPCRPSRPAQPEHASSAAILARQVASFDGPQGDAREGGRSHGPARRWSALVRGTARTWAFDHREHRRGRSRPSARSRGAVGSGSTLCVLRTRGGRLCARPRATRVPSASPRASRSRTRSRRSPRRRRRSRGRTSSLNIRPSLRCSALISGSGG